MADAIEKGTYQGPTSSHYGDIGPAETPGQTGGDWSLKEASGDEDFEIFRSTADGVNFRTLSWMWASVIFLKSAFESALSKRTVGPTYEWLANLSVSSFLIQWSLQRAS